MKLTRTLSFSLAVLGAASLTAFALWPAGQPAKHVALATVTTSVYAEALAAGWENWSWGTNANFAATTAHLGTRSIAVTHTEGWAGLFLHHNGLSLAGKQTLEFWIHGGSSGNQTLYIYAEDKSGRAVVQVPINSYVQGGKVVANAWRKVTMPLSALKLGAQYDLTGLTFQNGTDNSVATYYLDDIVFTGDGTTPSPTPFATPTFGPNAPAYPAATPVGARPAGLPNTFWFGVSSSPGGTDWMKQTGARWGARYQYLAGGVNTGEGWSKWNTPDGQFAASYLTESGNNNYVPIFTYYQMLHSSPRRYDESLASYQEKFRNAATMRAYYNDFKLLMQKCGTYNKTAIVHIEPDMWAYIQMVNTDPTRYPASVASSGQADVVGLPNNIYGFAQALVKIRDKYAPKTMLALHASPWATMIDVMRNRDPQLNVGAQAELTGTFLNKLGNGYSLVFVDIADRDAAYDQLVGNDSGTWFDETDVRLPSFKQAHHWIAKLNQKTGKRIVIWQVPIGNTKQRSCNNSHGHYQDNRVQYYLGANTSTARITNAANSGVIGILFGRGDDNTTAHTDEEGDGITNPAPINNNTGVAGFSDDDGGYLRARARVYTAAPVILK